MSTAILGSSKNCEERQFVLSCLSFCPTAPPSFRPSVRLFSQNNSAGTERVFMEFNIGLLLPKYVAKIQVLLKSDKNMRYCTWRQIYGLVIFRLRMRNVSDRVVEEIKTHTLHVYSIIFFRKSCSLWDNVGKYFIAGQSADDNMTHAHWMLDT